MIKLLSWILVLCIVLYFFSIMVMAFLSPPLIPFVVGVSVVTAIISGGLLLILLIRERIKDKEAEKDDLNKY
ncbi:hypothetical protein MFMK1_001471 [Metallumcola ferriviriculae]|uniref:NADH dehydrogenase subunit 6 n=1 Tax=Metallumcola ferriviriculae TaxID=3039180 RepID=A0AAU0UN64_9FIRM|nr:hypothetical protein MFMK1_001471 [Desulfitibacteraceae bacterium MK1]